MPLSLDPDMWRMRHRPATGVRYEQVIELLEKEIDRNLEYDRTHLLMAVSNAYLDRADDANWELEEAIAANPDLTLESEKLHSVLKRQQDLDHYLEGLKLAGL